MPTRFPFQKAMASERRHRCPECREFFEEGEEVVQGDGWWLFHPACQTKRLNRKSELEQKPKESAWHARGRVIKKGDSL